MSSNNSLVVEISDSNSYQSDEQISIDFSIETVSSDTDYSNIVESWNTDQNISTIELSTEEEIALIRQSILDVSLQEDIEDLNLVSIDEIHNMN